MRAKKSVRSESSIQDAKWLAPIGGPSETELQRTSPAADVGRERGD